MIDKKDFWELAHNLSNFEPPISTRAQLGPLCESIESEPLVSTK